MQPNLPLLLPVLLFCSCWAGPGAPLPADSPAALGMDEGMLAQARDYALSGGGSGLVLRHGKIAIAWGDQATRYDLKSTTKSFGSIALGLALLDGVVQLEDPARKHHPTLGIPPNTNRVEWLHKVTLLHLASQTAGFEKPGGFTPLLFEPGTRWDYSDSGPNWLAECLTLRWKRDLDEVMFERIFTPLGIRRDDLTWRRNSYRPATIEGVNRREFGAGIHANVNAMARIGQLMLQQGRWEGRQLLPAGFCRTAPKTPPGHAALPVLHPETYGNAARHYGLLWWNNEDGTLAAVPRDAYWSWGLYDSLIVVMPGLDLVVARAGQSWKREPKAEHYAVLAPLLEPIVQSVTKPSAEGQSGYPPSPVIREIRWAPKETILRHAKGGDNWPITWADDDALYTAYGDGWGFEPLLPTKLSMGLAKVEGMPPRISGTNIRSTTFEARGDDKAGRKASGLLSIDGVLWALVRNCGNSQLGWSRDHGLNWQWADWKFTTSFGCPTFLNFGRNYAGARDEFVYVYSNDSDSAYLPADRFVLARAPRDHMAEREAWEYFAGLKGGAPQWTKDPAQRHSVFDRPGGCYRSGISYHPGVKRYLWVQILPQSRHPQGPRFQGGMGIYDAPEPWGPWTTVFHTTDWDVGPGETASFPPKWMLPGNTQLHLVFSGDDCFSVRKADLELRE